MIHDAWPHAVSPVGHSISNHGTVGEFDGILAASVAHNTALTVTGDTVLDVLSHAQLQLASAGIVATAAVLGPGDAERARFDSRLDDVGVHEDAGAALRAAVQDVEDAA